jgi:NAD(P)-dependent dehydrogenase (short-subunit alcohol dehydrogenase family)
MKLEAGQTAVITGAGSGIGLALARALAERGLRLALVDRDGSRLADVVATLAAAGGVVRAFIADVADHGSVDHVATQVAAAFGPVRLLANNAGILRLGSAYDASRADWQAVIDVNVFGVIHGYRAFVPGMLAHGQPCHVLNTASLGGLIVGPQSAPYLVSKRAVVALSESLAVDTAGTNLGVTVLCPGGVATDIVAAEVRRRRVDDSPLSAAAQEQLASIADAQRADVYDPATIAAVALHAVERGELYALRFSAASRETLRRRLAAIEVALLRVT